MFKQLIAQLVKDKVTEPQNILYFPFASNMDEESIIRDLVNLFQRRYAKEKNGQQYIFLDEVQFVSSWPDQVKFFYDQDLPIKFVLTGSTTLFGGKKVRPLLRAEFPRFLAAGQFPELAVHPEIDSHEYLISVADQLINFDIPYLHTKVDRTLFTALVKTLSFELANEVSVNRLATGLSADRRTIGEYVRILEETGYFAVCLNGFYRKMRSKLSASKKVYALNTNLALAINGFDETYFHDSRVFGHYAENYAYLRLREQFGPSLEYYSEKGLL